MRAVIILSLFLSFSAAHAQDEEPAEPAEAEPAGPVGDGGEMIITDGGEMIIFGHVQVAEALKVLDHDLQALGYRKGKQKGDRIVYRPHVAWKPSVVLHDEGYVTLHRTPIRFEAPDGNTKLRYLRCLPTLLTGCIKIGGMLISPKKLHHHKARAVYAIHPDMLQWQEAIVGLAMDGKLGVLPDQLDALWIEGTPIDGMPAEPFVDPPARVAALTKHWSSRTCTAEGELVSTVVAIFLEEVVQPSEWALTSAQIQQLELDHPCYRMLGF